MNWIRNKMDLKWIWSKQKYIESKKLDFFPTLQSTTGRDTRKETILWLRN